MANSVKFILIKKASGEYIGNGVGTEYYNKLQEALAIPGSVIFGSYKKSSESSKVYHELWANGQLYSIGGSGDIYVYEGTDNPEDYFASGHDGANSEVSTGTYYIKLKDLDGDSENGEAINERTAYILTDPDHKTDSSYWKALNGNVDAENVYFPFGFERTKAWGTAEEKTDPTSDTDIVGKNLKEIFEFYLVEEMWPNVKTRTLNGDSPQFTANDGGCVLTVQNTDANGNTISNGSDVLYNTKLYITSVYTPTLSTGVSPASSITFGPNQVYDMYNKGWATSTTGTVTAENYRNGSQVTITSTITESDGANTSVLSIAGTDVKTETAQNGNAVSLTYTSENQTTLGSKLIKVTNTNGLVRSAIYKNSDNEEITSISLPPTGETYYLSNKGNRADDKHKNATSSTISLPANVTKNITNPEITCNIYLPVYIYKNGTTSEAVRYYGSSKTVYNESGIGLPGSYLNLYIEFPATSSVGSLTVGGRPAESAHYTTTSTSHTIKGVSVPYTKLLFTDLAACDASATITLTIN